MKTKTWDTIVTLLLCVPMMLWIAWVAKTLWWWAPTIGMAWVVGMVTTVVYVRRGNMDQPEEKKSSKVGVVQYAVFNAFALLFGCVAHLLMKP